MAIGLFVAGLGVARTVGVVPLGWAGDRYDKRTLLLVALAVSIVAYLLFPLVETTGGFIAVRILQGFGVLGTGLLGLATVVGGWLMTNVGIDVVFFLGSAAALSGALTLFGVLSVSHWRPTLAEW